MRRSLTTLPGTTDGVYQQLWHEGRLKFTGDESDEIDFFSASLIVAALQGKARLLIELPDSRVRRRALLLATALIRSWYDTRGSGGTVLYVGSTIGVRAHLADVRVGHTRLAELFSQQDLKRGAGQASVPYRNSGLPTLVTAFGPADPVELVKSVKPLAIVVDLDSSAQVDWLEPLLMAADAHSLPLVAWGQNPLSGAASAFARYGRIITWPLSHFGRSLPRTSIRMPLESMTTTIEPLIINSELATLVSRRIHMAVRLLADAGRKAEGRLASEAVSVHWRFLKSLESLAVPLDIFETETSQYWGIRSLFQTSETCRAFRSRLGAEVRVALDECGRLLDDVLDIYREHDAPLWHALANLAIDTDLKDPHRLFVFPSRARRDIFSFAMLARYGASEADLHEVDVWMSDLREVHSWNQASEQGDSLPLDRALADSSPTLPVVPGLLNTSAGTRALPLLSFPEVCVTLYPHQVAQLARQAQRWSEALILDPEEMARAVDDLGGVGHSLRSESGTPFPRVLTLEPNLIEAEASSQSFRERPWVQQEFDEVYELSRLLEIDEDADDEPGTGARRMEVSDGDEADATEVPDWVMEAFHVTFSEGWVGTFTSGFFLNVAVELGGRRSLDLRSVDSLRPGDHVLLIHDQRRQDLYSLILTRLHNHPSFEVHLALIRRWREDLARAYNQRDRAAIPGLPTVLKEMRERGSSLTSSATLQQWVWGQRLGPSDGEDLLRIAQVLEMDFVARNYRRINAAAARIRGLHRGLANRLNRWLERQTGDAMPESDDLPIDNDLGITFGDFRQSLMLVRVERIERRQGPFLTSRLGSVERAAN